MLIQNNILTSNPLTPIHFSYRKHSLYLFKNSCFGHHHQGAHITNSLIFQSFSILFLLTSVHCRGTSRACWCSSLSSLWYWPNYLSLQMSSLCLVYLRLMSLVDPKLLEPRATRTHMWFSSFFVSSKTVCTFGRSLVKNLHSHMFRYRWQNRHCIH